MEHPAHKGEAHPAIGHLVPWTVLLATCVALIVLTWITVTAAAIDLGRLNLWIAIAIATIKASLVCLYFMHLRYDRPFNAIVLVAALVFLMLFIGLAMTDSVSYQSELYPPDSPDYAPAITSLRARTG